MTEQELRQLTKQDFYNLNVLHAKDGTFPSWGPSASCCVSCYYRLDRTPTCKQRCPIGDLIPDEKYDDYIEGKTVFTRTIRDIVIIPPGITKDDLSDLQLIHDSIADEWDSNKFIRGINELSCFQDVQRCEV